jgi:hypothetical protein
VNFKNFKAKLIFAKVKEPKQEKEHPTVKSPSSSPVTATKVASAPISNETPKRKRGRPRKNPESTETKVTKSNVDEKDISPKKAKKVTVEVSEDSDSDSSKSR